MKKRFLKKLKNESGQSLVELAIALPVLLLILCGIIDFGWLFYNKLAISNLSREGARYVVVNADNANVVDLATSRIENSAPSSLKKQLTVDVVFSDVSDKSAGDVTVSVKSKIKILTPVMGMFFDNQEADVDSSVTMKVE